LADTPIIPLHQLLDESEHGMAIQGGRSRGVDFVLNQGVKLIEGVIVKVEPIVGDTVGILCLKLGPPFLNKRHAELLVTGQLIYRRY
ncbi:hypothetical protein, partial [Burkholderia sp. SIMBA_019]|uniref:hypothetical protein n=1 Tax=Burkholderia sp. SIMBA_019 TaxID=3085765 RepID=UPI0039788C6A